MAKIILEIIEDKTPKFKTLAKIGLFSILLFLIDILIIENFIIKNVITSGIAIISGIFFLVFFFGQAFIEKVKKNGKMIISDNYIKLENEKIDFNQIEKIKIVCNSYDGQFTLSRTSPTMMEDGIDNYIIIHTTEKVIKKEFYIQGQIEMNQLRDAIQLWSDKGILYNS
ncbi:MAG: hypothetical protein A2046_02440 [Bacteroidetes bacterium GWA2_30_7]|nr:MAG: hypothetical protein A2046_02440 [Bacteroidetes bacterium GWA2_30_7]